MKPRQANLCDLPRELPRPAKPRKRVPCLQFREVFCKNCHPPGRAWLQTAGHDQENPSGRASGEPFPPTPTSWGWAVWGGEALALELHLRMQDNPHAPSTPGLRFQPPCHPGFSPLGRVGDARCTHWAVLLCQQQDGLVGTSLLVQWLRLRASNTGGTDSVPSWGIETLQPNAAAKKN